MDNWETLIRQATSAPYFSRNRGDFESQRERVDTLRPTTRSTNHLNRFTTRNTTGYGNTDGIRRRNYNDGNLPHSGSNNSDDQADLYLLTFPTLRRNSRQQNFYQRDRRWRRPPSSDTRPDDSRRIQPSAPRPLPGQETHYRPCYNCGETNHSHSECRFQQRVKCNSCNEFGHKTRLCNSNFI